MITRGLTTPQLKAAVQQINRRGLISNQTGEKDSVLVQMNPREASLLPHLLGTPPVVRRGMGILAFPPGGGQTSHDHDAAAGAGGNGGGGGVGGPGGGPHSPGGAGGIGGIGGGDPSKGGSPSNDPGFSGGHLGGVDPAGPEMSAEALRSMAPTQNPQVSINRASSEDPTSFHALVTGLLGRVFSKPNLTTPQGMAKVGLGLATMGLPNPIGPAASLGVNLGAQMGEQNAQVNAGIKDGNIAGPGIGQSTDAEGNTVGTVGGSSYGGFAGHGGGVDSGHSDHDPSGVPAQSTPSGVSTSSPAQSTANSMVTPTVPVGVSGNLFSQGYLGDPFNGRFGQSKPLNPYLIGQVPGLLNSSPQGTGWVGSASYHPAGLLG